MKIIVIFLLFLFLFSLSKSSNGSIQEQYAYLLRKLKNTTTPNRFSDLYKKDKSYPKSVGIVIKIIIISKYYLLFIIFILIQILNMYLIMNKMKGQEKKRDSIMQDYGVKQNGLMWEYMSLPVSLTLSMLKGFSDILLSLNRNYVTVCQHLA